MSIASDCGLTELQYAASQYSDVFKDAHGFRPRQDTSSWTLEDFDRELARLYVICEREREWQAMEDAQAIKEFEATVAKLIARGAKHRETAIEWLLDGNGGDTESLCYHMGLPYGYLNRPQAA